MSKKEKVYRVAVLVEIYGQRSKNAVENFIHEAMHVDGLHVLRIDEIGLVPTKVEKPTTN